MMIGTHPLAINPIQFAATEDGWFAFDGMPPLPALLELVTDAGFTAVCADPPADGSGSLYAAELAAAGLDVGPGYLAVEWDDEPGAPPLATMTGEIERLAECGAPLVFLGMTVHRGSSRYTRPALGVDASADRLNRIAAHLSELCGLLRSFGLVGALHPHIGSWIETEAETRAVLAAVDGLRFGPDIGHLAWARADIEGLLSDFRPSVAGMHIKDHSQRVLLESLAGGYDYARTVAAGLWTDPGHGDADIAAAVATLEDPTSWLVIEVDRPPDMNAAASLRRCAEWARGE